jgi:hypothetical protein
MKKEVAHTRGGADGRQFSHALIGAVAPILQQQVDDALAQLVSAELILRRAYTFKHQLRTCSQRSGTMARCRQRTAAYPDFWSN